MSGFREGVGSSRVNKGRSRRYAAGVAAVAAVVWGSAALQAAPKTHTPATGTALASLLNTQSGPAGALELGDTIVLTAGVTYSGAEITLPNVTAGSGWITIQSSAMANLPGPGVRVKPWDPATSPVPGQLNHRQYMPKIASFGNNARAIKTANGAHNFKLIGIEIHKGSDADEQLDGLIQIGSGTTTDASVQPYNIIFDRCFMHGLEQVPPTLHTKVGIRLDCGNAAIINSHISHIHSLTQQAVGIGGINGKGPYLIDNNFIDASGENIIFGGGGGSIVGQVPTGITITRNHLWKNPSFSTSQMTCNHFELKIGRQVWFSNNYMENNWDGQGQGGNTVLLKVANVGSSPWFVTEDVMVGNNIARNIGMGVVLQGDDYNAAHGGHVKRIMIRNNLMFDVKNTNGTGFAFQSTHGPEDVTWDHNTIINNGTKFMNLDVLSEKVPNAVYTNNLTAHGTYGIWGTSTSYGDSSINGYFLPGHVWEKNVMVNITGHSIGNLTTWFAGHPGSWSPTSNAFPAAWTNVITDATTPGTNYANFKVKTATAWKNAGTDGKDVGADIDSLVTATSGCVSGTWTFNPNTPNASDSFPYTTTLNGGNEIGYGFDPNAWTQWGTSVNPAVSAGSLAYTDSAGNILTVSGNKLAPAVNSRSYRNLPTANQFVPQAGDVLWVSFRVNYTGASSFPSNHAGFALYSSLNADAAGDEFFMGNPGFSGQNWGFNPEGGTRVVAPGTVTTGAPKNVLLLYKLAYTSTGANVSMWINPNITSEGTLGTPQATGTQPGLDAVRSVMISTGASASGYQFDELRLGRTFYSVTPH